MPQIIRCRSCNERIAWTPELEQEEDVRCPSCGAHVSVRAGGANRGPRAGSRGGMRIVIGLLVAGGLLAACCGGIIFAGWSWLVGPTSFPEQTEDYAVARQKFQTRLTQTAAAPQPWEKVTPPEDVDEVEYNSNGLKLKAWMDKPQPGGVRRPVVLFLHGGFAFGEDDWEQTEPFRKAGFVVMIPILRGENGQPGHYSMFYNEVNDVLAAAEVLAKRPNVDPNRMYVAGHSVGGTLAMLAAMTSNRFRAAASFSGSPDQVKWSRGQVIPFDPKDQREMQMRSPLAFARSFKCPTRLYYGDEEFTFGPSTKKTAQLAKAAGLDVEAVAVDGDHFSAVEAAMPQCIQFFQQK
jgi:dipeptidyl aminopeptidase/acylaminoacyl peptidase